MALDKYTGEKLWDFNVGAPVGIGGPAIGNGMLYVTTGIPAEIPAHEAGSVVAFGLPSESTEGRMNATATTITDMSAPITDAAVTEETGQQQQQQPMPSQQNSLQ